MKPQERDLIVLVGGPERARRSLERLLFAPPLRVRPLAGPPDPAGPEPEPLLYLLGQSESLRDGDAITAWLDRLADAEGAPVALLVPPPGLEWSAATAPPPFCGCLLYTSPTPPDPT